MNTRNMGYMLIVAQTFAFFVALSLFLGRVYFIAYYDSLGIPQSDFRLTPIEYTIISPDVTILGIGTTALIAGLLVLAPWVSVEKWDVRRVLIGAGMITIGAVIEFVPIREISLLNRPGLPGIYELFQTSLVIGGSFLATSANPFPAIRSISSKEDSIDGSKHYSKRANFLLPLLVLMTILSVTAITFLITSSSSMVARIDAARTLEETAQVHIEFKRDITYNPVGNGGFRCNVDTNVCKFDLVALGTQFVYVQGIDSDHTGVQSSIYSFPIEDIAQMAYISETREE